MSGKPPKSFKNTVLSSLPTSEYRRLAPHLQEIQVSRGQILHESGDPARDVHFLDEGVAAISVGSEDGDQIGLSIVGNEGVIGERAIFKEGVFVIRCAMLTDGKGYRMSPGAFSREFERGEGLHDLVLNRMEARLTESAQTSMCNQVHSLEERLVRWLLVFSDRLHRDEFDITHEEMADFIGVTRSGVTLAAGALADNRLIKYSRGTVSIIDRARLEAAACECYAIIKETIETFAN